ncbi:MAG: pyruvate kinase [Patescibacteria group bacterium]
MLKKTKIVCTIGPATETVEMLEKLVLGGMNVMRLNFSHGDFEEHRNRVANLKKVIEKTGQKVAILQDLAGPKIRIGNFKNDRIELKEGQMFTLTIDEIEGDENKVHINYPHLPMEVAQGHIIFLHDGKKKLEVVEVMGNDVVCKVLVGGEIKSKRGVNLPDSNISISSLTEKDRGDLEFGIENDVDFIALSFVRRPEDIAELREIIKNHNVDARLRNAPAWEPKIIAKIETPQAVKNIDKIIEITDGIMVARGDLAIEIPAEKVPFVQKEIIRKCNDAGKPVITATQMLESMITSPIPTRAEVSDVANAILDGTDAIMLSEETTLGNYPLEAVKIMARVAKEIEANYPEREIVHSPKNGKTVVTDSLTRSVVKTAHDVSAKAIVALTGSGFSARMISRHKPRVPIFSLSANVKTVNQMCASFGCVPILIEEWKSVPEAFEIVRNICLEKGIAKMGDRVVIIAGAHTENRNIQETNMLLVETI